MNIGRDLCKCIEAVIADATTRAKADGIEMGPLDEFEIETWKQLWGSTALGFSGIGGATICSAYTILAWAHYKTRCYVYFAGRYAYTVKSPNDFFRKAYAERRMPSVRDARKLED